MMRAVFAVMIALSSASCITNRCAEVEALPNDRNILALGDSILAWSADRCQSIPDHAATEIGNHIVNNAVNGARVLHGSPEVPAIPDQYVEAPDGKECAEHDQGNLHGPDFLVDEETRSRRQLHH